MSKLPAQKRTLANFGFGTAGCLSPLVNSKTVPGSMPGEGSQIGWQKLVNSMVIRMCKQPNS
jgi:hypothetical protein